MPPRMIPRVSSCSMDFASGMIVAEMKLFHASLLNSPTPSTNGGTPRIAATVRLSSCTTSEIAKSDSDSGLTVSTEN